MLWTVWVQHLRGWRRHLMFKDYSLLLDSGFSETQIPGSKIWEFLLQSTESSRRIREIINYPSNRISKSTRSIPKMTTSKLTIKRKKWNWKNQGNWCWSLACLGSKWTSQRKGVCGRSARWMRINWPAWPSTRRRRCRNSKLVTWWGSTRRLGHRTTTPLYRWM